MKKFLKAVSIVIVIIFLICLTSKLGILDFFKSNVSEQELASYTDYYFKLLEQDEKEMYVRIDEAVKNKQKNVNIGDYTVTELNQKVNKVITAYFYDNPEYYWISNQYIIATRDFTLFKYSTIELDYTVEDELEIAVKDNKLEKVVNEILQKNIIEGMSDFEKELAIHDALVEHVNYYEYENIDEIPSIKHTAYGALVEKEAVCDGYAKAYKILLDAAGIDNVIIYGTTDNVAHAWNMVELNGEYYHVDVTSDQVNNADSKHVIHTYFNVTDETISKTHTIDTTFNHLVGTATEYNYYTQMEYDVTNEESLYTQLKDIISKQKYSNTLEFRASEKITDRNIIDTLYELNFNNWRFSGKTSVSYNKLGNIYVFIK